MGVKRSRYRFWSFGSGSEIQALQADIGVWDSESSVQSFEDLLRPCRWKLMKTWIARRHNTSFVPNALFRV